MVGGINQIIDSVSRMRNNFSDSHGSSKRVSIKLAEAELVLNSSVNIVNYYLKVNNRKNN